jgi:hypothetical protein
VPIGGDPVGRKAGDRLGRPKERFGGSHVTVLAEHHVDQHAAAVDGAIEIAPAPVHLEVGPIDIPTAASLAPTAASLAAATPTQWFGQGRRQLGFPLANRLVAEHNAADQEHLRPVTQGELVAQAPEHHEGNDVGGILGPVQHAAAALVELLAADATAEPTVALRGALDPFRNGGRAAPNALHLRDPPVGSPFTQTRLH